MTSNNKNFVALQSWPEIEEYLEKSPSLKGERISSLARLQKLVHFRHQVELIIIKYIRSKS